MLAAQARRAAALAPEALALADHALAAGQQPVAAAALRIVLAGAPALSGEALAAVLQRCATAGMAAEAVSACAACKAGVASAEAFTAALMKDQTAARQYLRAAGLLAEEAMCAAAWESASNPVQAQRRWEGRLGMGMGGLQVALAHSA